VTLGTDVVFVADTTHVLTVTDVPTPENAVSMTTFALSIGDSATGSNMWS